MQKWSLWRYSRPMLFAVFIAAVSAAPAFATTSTSSNYKMSEAQFGAGSRAQSCSGQYCARVSIGNIGGGNKTTTGTATFAQIEGDEPRLEVIVDPGISNLGVLTTEQTATKTSTVRINNYFAGGYTIQLVGDPPKFSGHTLNAPTSPTASDPGAEQFAINLAANTTPNVGSNPVQVPSGQGTFGEADDDYDTPNLFKYTSEDVVARSLTYTGRTDYTITMIFNIANHTPAGHYTGDFAVVVMPQY